MKLLSLTVFVLVGCNAFAQTAQEVMRSATGNLLLQREFAMQLDGTVNLGNEQSTFQINSYYQTKRVNKQYRYYNETLRYSGATLIQRLVGDGENLWNFDPQKNEYSSVKYGSDPSSDEEKSLSDLAYMVKQFPLFLKGNSGSFLSRIYEDTFLKGIGGTWQPFLTLGKPRIEFDNDGNPTITVSTGNPVSNEMIYTLHKHEVNSNLFYSLDLITFWSKDTFNGKPRETNFTLELFWENFHSTDANFGFIPPRGSKCVSSGTKSGR
jgi:hypothetical protein